MTQEACVAPNPQQVKRNLFALLLDVISYWVGAAFTDPLTVLLVLMHNLGATSTLLGLCIALRFAGQYGVQVFVAYVMHGKPRQKPFLVWSVGLARLPMVALPFVIYHADTPGGKAIALWTTIGVLAFVGLGEGLGGVPWTEIVARAFTRTTRGRFLAAAQTSAGILNILIAWQLVTRVLAHSYPWNYTILVGLSALMFQISTLGLALIDEPDVPPGCIETEARPPLREYLAELPQMIRSDKTFSRLVTIQLFVNSGWAALPFYANHAIQHFHLKDDWAGTFQVLQALSIALLMPMWAFLSERKSPASAVRGVSLVCMVTPILALTIGSLSPWYFALVFLLTGGSLTAGGIWVVMQHFLLTHTEEGERPKYIALLNLLNLPSALFPLLGSTLVRDDQFIRIGRVPVLLVIIACTVAIGFALSLRLSLSDDTGDPQAGSRAPVSPPASEPLIVPDAGNGEGGTGHPDLPGSETNGDLNGRAVLGPRI
jgi:MFS family permease